MYTESRAGGSAKGFDPNGDVKPDAIIKMSEKLFNDISEGRASPIMATITGKMQFEGKLNVLRRFDSIVVKKYCCDPTDERAQAYLAAK